MSLFLHQIWRNVSLHQCLSNGCSAVNGCRQICFSFCLLQMITECCGLLWCFYQTLILTAPIHCRASIAETLMQRHISPNLMKKQTHLLLGWPNGQYIFQQISSFGWTTSWSRALNPNHQTDLRLSWFGSGILLLVLNWSSTAIIWTNTNPESWYFYALYGNSYLSWHVHGAPFK